MHPVLKEIRKIVINYGAKVRFKKLKDGISGLAYYEDNLIEIDPGSYSRIELLNCVFHELGHLMCYKKGLWKDYHLSDDPVLRLKTALKAERYVDRWAEHELFLYDKRVKFLSGYSNLSNKETKKFLEEYFMKNS